MTFEGSSYFLQSDSAKTTPLFVEPILTSEDRPQDECCLASGGITEGLLEACVEEENLKSTIYTWEETNETCIETMETEFTYFLPTDRTSPIDRFTMTKLSSEIKTVDDCCFKSEGSDTALLLACMRYNDIKDTTYTWEAGSCVARVVTDIGYYLLIEDVKVYTDTEVNNVNTFADACCENSAGSGPLVDACVAEVDEN